jgi:2-polyprenyl-3-methyl-5-hydroxy-6-metoxy-1,4-benzoquinol methylase
VEHSLETLENCPSCGGFHFDKKLSCIDHTYSKKEFTIVKCKSCGLHFTNPRPSVKEIGVYYDSPDYVSHTDTNKGLLFTLYGIVKSYTLGQKRKLLESFSNEKTVLDYGAGSGDFSNELATNGWDVTSYEPDQKARKLVEQKNASIKMTNSLSEVENKSKSVIALWHVLEHVHELQTTTEEFNRILTDNGKLIIAVPNHTSFDATFYEENWAAYDVPRHLYHFNPTTIEPLMKSKGFRLVTIKPMWFDSYYVSLLSEKNTGAKGYLQSLIGWSRAFVVGSFSNIKTIGDTKRCSSLTYIFEKAI